MSQPDTPSNPYDFLGISQPTSDFEKDLVKLINIYSQELGTRTPDFILARYLVLTLRAFEVTMAARDSWFMP